MALPHRIYCRHPPAIHIPTKVDTVQGDAHERLHTIVKAAHDYRKVRRDTAGTQIVGRNNLGQVQFDWPSGLASPKSVTQRLWWRKDDQTDLAPLSTFVIPLDPSPEPPPSGSRRHDL